VRFFVVNYTYRILDRYENDVSRAFDFRIAEKIMGLLKSEHL